MLRGEVGLLMKRYRFNLTIEEIRGDGYLVSVRRRCSSARLLFNPSLKTLQYLSTGRTASAVRRNERQFLKILYSMDSVEVNKGFCLRFVLTDGKDTARFEDLEKTAVLDRRFGGYRTYVRSRGRQGIHCLYTDGSFNPATGKSAYAIIVEPPSGGPRIITGRLDVSNSSLTELIAVIRGLELLGKTRKVRIVTDSLYVRKGIVEWMANWKMNDWITAGGGRARHLDYWKKIDALTRGRYIEVQWVRAHRNHPQNTICDLCARAAADA